MFLVCLTQLSCITIRIEIDTTGGDQSMKSARHDGRGISAEEDTTVRDQIVLDTTVGRESIKNAKRDRGRKV